MKYAPTRFTALAAFTLMVATLVVAPAYAGRLKVVNPDDPQYQSSDSSIKFQANPMSQAIQGLQQRTNQMQKDLEAHQKRIQTLEAEKAELMETTTAQGAVIIQLNQQVESLSQNVKGIINCGSGGETYNGGRCISPRDMRR